ncbi:PD-(D/E)XK nuclease family protein [Blattabacterium cuenoti]|uniref:PD-(D/E)XK nuclease family protein n=1 Tax=Blattabacterium cuenoti TaxID=1653831 RepID=UPI001EE9CA19|nr:PD-(D/E)XK nuclease family protein [Blattabacterium cuenoti]
MLFKTAIYRLDSFLHKKINFKIILLIIDHVVFNECEKIFIQKIIQKGLVYDLYEKNIPISSLKSLNENQIFNSKTFLQKNCFKIVSVSKEIEQIRIVKNIIDKLIKKNKNPEKILLIPGEKNLTFPLADAIKKLGVNISLNINYSLNNIPIYYTFYSIFQLLIKKNQLKKFLKRDVIKVLSNGYIQKFFLKKNSILKKLNQENDSDFVCENVIKKYLYRNDLWMIFQIQTHDIKIIIVSIISFIKKFKKFLFSNKKKHFLELKFIYKLEIYIKKLRIIVRKNKNLFIGINDIYNIYEEFTHTENIRYIYNKYKRGLYITGFIDVFFKNFDYVIITSFNEGVIPPNHKNSFIPFSICKKLQINNNFNENFYFHHFTRIMKFSKKIYAIYKNQQDEINSGEKSRFIHRMEINSKISEERIKKPFFPINLKRQPIIINKTKSIIQCLDKLINKGLSPSSIHLYNDNPLLFYYKKILKLNDTEKTSHKKKIGKIIHQILKILYDPVKENSMTLDCIYNMKKNYKSIIKKIMIGKDEIFEIEGNNMFFYHIIKNYIKNFISWDEKFIKNGHKIVIKEIERKASAILKIGSKKVNLHGIIDRIDEYDGITRILDYKIGFSKIKKINISSKNIKNIFYDTNYTNTMQLLIYVYLWFKSSRFKESQKKTPVIGIVSPEMNGNILQIPVNIFRFQNENTNITYADYQIKILPFLIQRIYDILNPNIPIIEKIY